MTDWVTIRVVLNGTARRPLGEPPGRVLLASADHSFADLAEAVDLAFARWDASPLHLFDLDGRRLVTSSDDPADPDAEDSAEVTLGEAGLRIGAPFLYVFDLDQRWRHECSLESANVDPVEAYGEEPDVPVPLFGWGNVPDQYGRVTEHGAGWDADGPQPDNEQLQALTVVRRALGGVDRPLDRDELAAATGRARAHTEDAETVYAVLWEAADLEADEAPGDDADLWVELAAAVVAPRADALEDESEAAWATLEPADWAGAVIELVRGGVGQRAEPDDLLELILRCPEIDADELDDEDVQSLLEALDGAVELLTALGAIDADHRLTRLGHWGLPEALERAWA